MRQRFKGEVIYRIWVWQWEHLGRWYPATQLWKNMQVVGWQRKRWRCRGYCTALERV